ncbi:GNAT family N-acetyltransferase [Flavivirga aquatica]|uniref:GNAT family N-acetyltransferase n=1 Tax=Flavivirga aquatica TaxID=1849968 RepID=A0A1E5T440_9FLAO|nr:GNAT family N-acetyltransferase [Flavivirga aquatica]OEK06037.1 GNAT family N-acetyltransferase [Flavivirga aquatica]
MSLKITEISVQETYNLRHQVMWPNKPQSYIQLKEDSQGIHFGLWKDSNIISVVSLFIKNDSVQFRKLATKVSEQGQGYGTLLLEHLIAFVLDKKLNKLWCNARADKTFFYERFGMLKTSKTYTKGGIDFVIMEKCF